MFDKISINLMWINKKFYEEQNYVFPDKQLDIILSSLKGWDEKNPDQEINFWYDSKFTSPALLKNTEEKFANMKSF